MTKKGFGMFRHFLKNNPEEKQKPASTSYLSYFKKLMPSASIKTLFKPSLPINDISALIKLIFSLDLLSYLPKSKADTIYCLFEKVYYALNYDSNPPLNNLSSELIEACSSITFFNSSQTNYTDFFTAGCVGKNLTIGARNDNTNMTMSILNCTVQLVNQLTQSCEQDEDNSMWIFAIVPLTLAGVVSTIIFGCMCAHSKNTAEKNDENKPRNNEAKLFPPLSAPDSYEQYEQHDITEEEQQKKTFNPTTL
jgi:hypothetical protein